MNNVSQLSFSIIVPVYNRPQEIDELLASLVAQTFSTPFEVLIIEDGSTDSCAAVVEKYNTQLNVHYYAKENSGAGQSRNFGMQQATGNYFLILDSDVLLPPQYLAVVSERLQAHYTDAFGGPDAAHASFTTLQKAINYSMTSVLTTGGIRGKKKALSKFQPRSFNFGMSKEAFVKTGGFADLKVGEDIDLTFRLWSLGFETQLLEDAFVYHKRRTTLKAFFKQTFAFGTARPVLNKRHPKTAKITYWFPSLFIIGIDVSLVLAFFGFHQILCFYGFYFSLIFLDSLFQNKNLQVAFLSIVTSFTQFLGYGLGFLESRFLNKND